MVAILLFQTATFSGNQVLGSGSVISESEFFNPNVDFSDMNYVEGQALVWFNPTVSSSEIDEIFKECKTYAFYSENDFFRLCS